MKNIDMTIDYTKKMPLLDLDGIFVRLVNSLTNEQIIEFLNGVYCNDLPLNSTLERILPATIDTDFDENVTSFCFLVDKKPFHIELQSTESKNMAPVAMEDAFRFAASEALFTNMNGKLQLRFPESSIIYLSANAQTPKGIVDLKLEVPTNKGAGVFRTISVRLMDYSMDELLKMKFYPLLPFYPLNYEKVLQNNPTQKAVTECLDKINSGLKTLTENVSTYFEDDTSQEIIAQYINVAKKVVTSANLPQLQDEKA